MASEIEAYQSAIQEFRTAKAACENIAKIVFEGNKALVNWHRATVSNVPQGFPMNLALANGAAAIDASQWPTGQQIAVVLSNYHAVAQAMRNAYAAIPASQREVVQPPPK